MNSEPETRVHQLEIPVSTILKILITGVLVWALLKLWPQLLIVLVSVLIAVTLYPLIEWFERNRVSRGFAVLIVAVFSLLLLFLILLLVLPSLTDQIGRLIENWDVYRDRMQNRLRGSYPILSNVIGQAFDYAKSDEATGWLKRPFLWGPAALSSVIAAFFVFVLTIYLLYDGKGLYAYLLAYVPRRLRKKMGRTVEEVSEVIRAYVRAQFLTSFLCAASTVVVLTALNVPAAIPLAILAGVCDVIPFVGIIISTVPAVLLGMTVSPVTGGLVLLFCVIYNLIESYFIVPKIYGTHLQLSTLAVLIALMVGGTLQGIIGAILILPFVAAYPIIERIWLKDYLSDEVIHDHKALKEAAEEGSDVKVDKVLAGKKQETEQ